MMPTCTSSESALLLDGSVHDSILSSVWRIIVRGDATTMGNCLVREHEDWP